MFYLAKQWTQNGNNRQWTQNGNNRLDKRFLY